VLAWAWVLTEASQAMHATCKAALLLTLKFLVLNPRTFWSLRFDQTTTKNLILGRFILLSPD
jgi:hypothetical protein